ncbi:MAG: trehalose-phosphatase [Phycisphaerales bacterium]|jgi:trehalose-phosphatase|nr:trehalose-phosphatase [Phycisphaerales bacterium]
MSDHRHQQPLFRALADAVVRAASAPRLLVASDFDGTLAPLADRPELARPDPLAVEALRRLGALPGVCVAVISGRPRDSLRAMLAGVGDSVVLIGSHGAESPWSVPDDGPAFDLEAARAIAQSAALRVPGSWIEHKPAGIAWHFRGCDPILAAAVLRQSAANLSLVHGARVLAGHDVLECLPAHVSKARAFARLRDQVAPDCSVFFGDDEPDAEVFAALSHRDIGVAVGTPRAGAGWTVPSPPHVASILEMFAHARARRMPSAGPL